MLRVWQQAGQPDFHCVPKARSPVECHVTLAVAARLCPGVGGAGDARVSAQSRSVPGLLGLRAAIQ